MEKFIIYKIEPCQCGNKNCLSFTVDYESVEGWTQSIVAAKKYDSYGEAKDAVEDYLQFFQNVPGVAFHIQKLFANEN